MNTFEINGWRGHFGMGLTPQETRVTTSAASGMSFKEIARQFGVSEQAVTKRIADARLRLGNHRTTRTLLLEAYRRGIIAPLALALLIGAGHHEAQPTRRPDGPRTAYQLRIIRKAEDTAFTA